MIYWLASFPRSGCDLLRPVLRAAFGLETFNRHEPDGIALRAGARNAQTSSYVQQCRIAEPWDAFYDRSAAAPALTLIKTHLLPDDSSPCIHIVRDGRSCLTSFTRYLRSYYPQDKASVEQLIRGDHAIGSWGEHYFAWKSRPGARRMMLRYEELLEGSDDLLRSVAAFLELPAPAKKWAEVRSEIHAACPNFADDRMPRWRCPPFWTAEHSLEFRRLHSKAMRELGYDC